MNDHLQPYAADEVMVRVKLAEEAFPDEDGESIEWALTLTEGIESAEIVASNAVEHETAVDDLIGEIESTVSTLRGEATEVTGLNGASLARADIAEQLRHRAKELDAALEEYLDAAHPREREVKIA